MFRVFSLYLRCALENCLSMPSFSYGIANIIASIVTSGALDYVNAKLNSSHAY